MMRAFEARGDCAVFDEPFYGCYLKASGADHPYRAETLAALPITWDSARAALAAPIPAGKGIRFAKHIAYHYPHDEPLTWLAGERSFILIRDPRAMVASFARKFDDIAPIVDSYRVCRRIAAFAMSWARPALPSTPPTFWRIRPECSPRSALRSTFPIRSACSPGQPVRAFRTGHGRRTGMTP